MDNEPVSFGEILLYLLITILFILINMLRFSKSIIRDWPGIYKILPKQNLKNSFKIHLTRRLRFYNHLDPVAKVKFEKRVQQFINMKQFIPRSKGLVITDEMKAIIAGTAVMVTYGFPQVFLSHFHKILIYSDNYYSTITRHYHKGEVNPRGFIVLSWVSLNDGYITGDDGINLGIHEMAHALRIENVFRNDEYGFLSGEALGDFDEIAEREILLLSNGNGNDNLLRDYSITNKQEFFAVAVEYFFENPVKLKDSKIDVYNTLALLLKVDPVKILCNS